MDMGQHMLQQTRALWAICERYEALVFKLNVLIPDAKTDVTHQLMSINAEQQTLAKRKRALLVYLLQDLKNHQQRLLKRNPTLTQVFVDEITQMLADLPRTQSMVLDQPVQSILQQLEHIVHSQQLQRIRSLVIRLEVALQVLQPTQRRHPLVPYQPGSLFRNWDLLMNLMQYDAYPHDYPGVDAATFIQWLAYHKGNTRIDDVTVTDLRTAVPEAKVTGLAGTAYSVVIGKEVEGYILFRGAERTGMAGEWQETALDWQYMLKSIMLGLPNESDQLPIARQFTQMIMGHLQLLSPDARLYGIGHSLGGQLVQAVQLLDHPFTAGFTLNSVPMQLQQLQSLAPKRFSKTQWHALKHHRGHNVSHLLQEFGEKAANIINVRFSQDFTALFYQAPGTISLGEERSFTLTNWHYPFTAKLSNFFTKNEISNLLELLRYALMRLRRASTQRQLKGQVGAFLFDTILTLYRNANIPATATFLDHLSQYLYACDFFTKAPVDFMTDASGKRHSFRLTFANLMNQREFFKSLNTAMFAPLVTLHIVNGVKFIVADNQQDIETEELGSSFVTQTTIPTQTAIQSVIAES
ncbi:hypothetical protein K9861_10450 [Lacticaseibacillus saniviri]|nr:DUF6792 domain-containing protein [Lacticaseibacillus saniviri]MCG4282805.1 hypothetical protein [Lacticaseibacillus saniviri]